MAEPAWGIRSRTWEGRPQIGRPSRDLGPAGCPLLEADALRFNPWNAGGGLEPTGLLNRLRDYAYPLSQRAWGRDRRAHDQAAAERAVERRLCRGGAPQGP